MYGRCPLGHNPKPSGVTGDYLSTTQIAEGTSTELFWSRVHQMFVCSFHLSRQHDARIDEIRHDKDVEADKDRSAMGFTKS